MYAEHVWHQWIADVKKSMSSGDSLFIFSLFRLCVSERKVNRCCVKESCEPGQCDRRYLYPINKSNGTFVQLLSYRLFRISFSWSIWGLFSSLFSYLVGSYNCLMFGCPTMDGITQLQCTIMHAFKEMNESDFHGQCLIWRISTANNAYTLDKLKHR